MPRLLPRLRSDWPSAETVQEGFRQPRFARLRLERFPRGVDNYHIDVVLGPALGKAASTYVAVLVREQVQRLWRQTEKTYSEGIVQSFGQVLKEHHHAVVQEARAAGRLERLQLFELSFLKLVFGQIDSELARLRAELEEARSQPARQLSGQSLKLHEQAVILGRHAAHVRFRVARELVRELMRLEHGSMKNRRKALLGVSWPVSELMLANPILQLDGIGAPRDFYRIYPMVLHDIASMRVANLAVLGVLATWLPDHVPADPDIAATTRVLSGRRQDQAGALGLVETERRLSQLFDPAELNDHSASWLDQPDNATALLGGAEEHWPVPGNWQHRGIAELQRRLNRQLGVRLARANLLRSVLASYELPAIYPSLGLTDAEVLLFDFLRGAVRRREMPRRLAALQGVTDPLAVMRRIEARRRDYRKDPANGRRQALARFAGDVLRLRRDLKLAWRTFIATDGVRLISDDRELAQSRANHVLQLFCREDLALQSRGDVIGHVIVRAQLRGVTELLEQMRRRDLSASAHFSRFLYDPIGRLIERFGAEKVTIEGDALLLSLLEHGGGAGSERLAVARACCLASGILGQLDTLNVENDRLGMPRLELGVGIAYADQPPTYLYDHMQRLTVSPAIKRARSLSSCHARLRETRPVPGGRGLCVASQVRGGDAGQVGDSLVRYNVNSIELDAAAFAQLNTEVALRRLNMIDKRRNRPGVLHVGSCADVHGEGHWLVVREHKVKLLMGSQLVETEDGGRHYYEVISDHRLIERLLERLPELGEILP
jgi:hypothetical protein